MNLGNYQKTPLAPSFQRTALQAAATAIQRLGRALPCAVTAVSGQTVTVKFEIATAQTLPSVTIPIAGWAYDWIPVQVGDAGVTMPADAYLGGVSGLGGGIAGTATPANMTALVFVPVANAAWSAPNPDQRVVQGPSGVLLRTMDGKSSVDITESAITMITQGKTVTLGSGGFTIDGIIFDTHEHGGVQTGGGKSGGPTNP